MLIEKDVENFIMLFWLNKYIAKHNGFICGGCFKNIFTNEKVKDLDVFFENEKDYIDAKLNFEKDNNFKLYYSNKNVTAFVDKNNIVVELNHKIFGTPEQILKQFDFTITKFAYYKTKTFDADNNIDLIEYCILCDENFFEHLFFKRLVCDDKIPYPMGTLERCFRYAKYGYFPCKETKLKLAESIHDMSTKDITVSNSLYEGHD